MPNIQLLNIDCIEFMKTQPNNAFDLAIVDPPYGINATGMNMGSNEKRSRKDGHGSGPSISTNKRLKGRLNSGGGQHKNTMLATSFDWDNQVPSQEYFDQLFRVSKNQIIWGGNYFHLPPTRCIICWDKKQAWENFSQWEMAWTSFDKPAALFRYSNSGGINREKKIHPTQKPIALYKWILSRFGKDVKSILDTHLGSGSSAIASYQMDLDFTGCEINELYYQDTIKRFNNSTLQNKLWPQ